jgi:hypothetical protein
MRRDEIPEFATWLVVHGAKMRDHLKPTDLLRFAHAGHIGVVRESGAAAAAIPSPFAQAYVEAFRRNLAMPSGPRRKAGDPKTAMETAYLRDGGDCFFCGRPLAGDVTCEHLLARADEGKRQAANVVLAHAACNRLAGRAPIADKIKLRDRMRGYVPILQTPPWASAVESRPQRRLPGNTTAASAKSTP